MELGKILVTKDSKINFLRGLIRLAKCDSILDDRELGFYYQAAYSMGLDENDTKEINLWIETSDKLEVNFETIREKMFFFVQAVQLCWIDEEYKEIEKEEMRILANELGISIESLEKVEQWAYEGIIWNNKGNELLDLK